VPCSQPFPSSTGFWQQPISNHGSSSRPTTTTSSIRWPEEEAEAAEAEIAEKAAALDVPLNLRITKDLDSQLRRQATAEQIPTSALVRRLLIRAVAKHRTGGLTAADVEQIARRVLHEEFTTR